MSTIKNRTTEDLQREAASLRKTVGNPFASRDMENRAYRALKPILAELTRRGEDA